MASADSGRSYARTYDRVRRRWDHALVEQAVGRAGGQILASTGPTRAPLFLGIEDESGHRLGICAYVFHANGRSIKNRPPDEHRVQVRYGNVNDAGWRAQEHPVGFDPLAADVTLVLGAHEEGFLIGLDPLIYDPLPLGISVEFKEAEVSRVHTDGWHVWERDNLTGIRRRPRTELRIETLVGFAPDRLLDFVRFERDAQTLRLDSALRFRAAQDAAHAADSEGLHRLEREFDLSGAEILDLIRERPRLGMAVRGGVAERHLEKALSVDPDVLEVALAQQEGPPDFVVRVRSVRGRLTIECKNASPKLSKGLPKVETQKTRASKGDPKSRLYEPRQFDILAACMYGPSKRWEFRYKRSDVLERHHEFPDRIAPIQRIDESWSRRLVDAIAAP